MTQNQEIQVVPVQEDDFFQWKIHWLAYQEFYKVNLPKEVTAETWSRFFDEAEPVYCAVAKQGDVILGFVHYVIHRSTWAINCYCYLEDLFVSNDARGKHVGKQLIEYVQQQSKDFECARLYWHTQETNHRAQRLYDWIAEKPGMIEYRMSLEESSNPILSINQG